MTNTATAGPPRRMKARVEYPREGTASVNEVLDFLGLGRTRLYDLIDLHEYTEGKQGLKSFHEGRYRKFDWKDVWAYHNSRKSA